MRVLQLTGMMPKNQKIDIIDIFDRHEKPQFEGVANDINKYHRYADRFVTRIESYEYEGESVICMKICY